MADFNNAFSRYDARAFLYKEKFALRVETPDELLSKAVNVNDLLKYVHRYGLFYFTELSLDELALLAMEFDAGMAELEVEEQVLILDIVAKRKLATIDGEIARLSIIAQFAEVGAAKLKMDARFKLLEADQERLTTMNKAVEIAIKKADARIDTLTAEIDTLGVEIQLVEAETLEKELDAERAKLAYLHAVQKALQIQQDIASIGLQISETEVRITEVEADKVKWEVQIQENSSQIKQLQAEKLQLETSLRQVQAKITETKASTAEVEYRHAGIDTEKIEMQARVQAINAESNSVEAQAKSSLARVSTISARIAEVAAEIVEIEAQTKGIVAQIAEADVDIARARLSESEYIVAQAEERLELQRAQNYWPVKTQLAQTRASAYSSLRTQYDQMPDLERSISSGRANVTSEKFSHEVERIRSDGDVNVEKLRNDIALENIYERAADVEADGLRERSVAEARVYRVRAQSGVKDWATQARVADILAKAEVVNALTHVISGAET